MAHAGDLPIECNFLVVGTGVAGLVGALRAKACGLNPVLIEKSALWGGTTALSGGVVWVPCNHLMERDGSADSLEQAREYLLNLLGNDPSARRRRKLDQYLATAPTMAAFLGGLGVNWVRNAEHPDYYPTVPGAVTGRAIEPDFFDGNQLGHDMKTMRGTSAGIPAMHTSKMGAFSRMKTGPIALFKAAAILGRNAVWRASGREPLSRGRALLAYLMTAVRTAGIPVLLNAKLIELTTDNDRIVGAVVETAAGRTKLSAPAGVLLAAGGFAHNAALRQKYHGDLDGTFSSAPQEDQGDGLLIGLAHGAATEHTEHAWWQPSLMVSPGQMSLTLTERAMPGSIIVDHVGKRFMNEAQSYMAAGSIMRRHSGAERAKWLVFDRAFLRRYFFRVLSNKTARASMLKHGYLRTADTVEQLAVDCEMEPAQLIKSVSRVNGFAVTGEDVDFRRGETSYERYWADPKHRPNQSLGKIAHPPFYAARLFDGDIGTNGGLMTDEFGRVLRNDETPITGLYAAGNTSGSPFAGAYPGGGATIGAAATFGYLAAQNAASAYSP